MKSKNTKGFSIAAESTKFAREIEANNLLFETSSGKIEKLYPANGESLHILNIKRGILSTLQLEEKNTEEIDVNGRCKVSITEENGMIVKAKDLSECSGRTHNEIGFHTASFENKEMVSFTYQCGYVVSSHCISTTPWNGVENIKLLQKINFY